MTSQRGDHVGPSPVDRGRPGSKHHLICDAGGIPLAVTLTGGNRNDITQLIPLVDAVPPIRGRRGRPRRRPRELFADRGYDHDVYRRQLRHRGITPRIARRGVAHGSGLGKQRWVVEPAGVCFTCDADAVCANVCATVVRSRPSAAVRGHRDPLGRTQV